MIDKAAIEREGESVTLSETREIDGGTQMMFAPVYEAWGREIPPEWTMFPAKDTKT